MAKYIFNKQRKALLSFVLISICLLSCLDRKQIEWQKVTSYEAPVFNHGRYNPILFQENGHSYIANLDATQAEIQIYDLKEERFLPTIDLSAIQTEGPLYSYYFIPHKTDSFFVFSSSTYDTDITHVMLCNDSGQLLQTYDIKVLFPSKEDYIIQPNQSSPALFKNGKLYFQKALKHYNASTAESRVKAYSEPTELILDISKEDITASNKFGNHPEEYYEANYSNIFSYRCINNRNELIYSYKKLDDIMVFDGEGEVRRFDAGSDYIHKMNAIPDGEKTDMTSKRKFMFEEPYYHSLYYDPFRELYLRLAFHRTQMVNAEGTINGFQAQSKSLIVLDQNFQRLGEIKLDEKTFLSIVGIIEEGVLVREIEADQSILAAYEVQLD